MLVDARKIWERRSRGALESWVTEIPAGNDKYRERRKDVPAEVGAGGQLQYPRAPIPCHQGKGRRGGFLPLRFLLSFRWP